MNAAIAHRRVLVINGHPDPEGGHLCHALAQAYADGARGAHHGVRMLDVARLEFPLLRKARDWEHGTVPPGLRDAQLDIEWAQHLVLVFPLWLGDMPAVLKGFLEQVARPGFAFKPGADGNPFAAKGLTGRSARVVVTMGMPALLYRFYFRAHSVRSLERNVLGFVGIAPVHETLIGQVGDMQPLAAQRWIDKLASMGRDAA